CRIMPRSCLQRFSVLGERCKKRTIISTNRITEIIASSSDSLREPFALSISRRPQPQSNTSRKRSMSQPDNAIPRATSFVEEVEIQGHIIDSLILPKALHEILPYGGSYVLKDIRVGQRQTEPRFARIEVRAPTGEILREILDNIHDHGAVPISAHDCQVVTADMDGAFPEG